MSGKNKKESISSVYVDVLSKKAIEKLVIEGEAAGICPPEKVIADMKEAKEDGGQVFIYKRKKEIKAICIFDFEEHDIPLGTAVVSEGEIFAGKSAEGKNREAEAGEDQELVRKKCFVMKGFYVVPSYDEYKDELKKLFGWVIRGYMLESVPAYIWEDEIIMANQVISGGKMVNAASIGAALGAAVGVMFCVIFDRSNIGMGLLWGCVIGAALAGGTTTVKSKLSSKK